MEDITLGNEEKINELYKDHPVLSGEENKESRYQLWKQIDRY